MPVHQSGINISADGAVPHYTTLHTYTHTNTLNTCYTTLHTHTHTHTNTLHYTHTQNKAKSKAKSLAVIKTVTTDPVKHGGAWTLFRH